MRWRAAAISPGAFFGRCSRLHRLGAHEADDDTCTDQRLAHHVESGPQDCQSSRVRWSVLCFVTYSPSSHHVATSTPTSMVCIRPRVLCL